MKVYLFMILWIVVVGFISKGSEVTETINGREEKRTNYTYAILMFAVIIIFTGLRSSVADTFTYIKNFDRLDVESTSLVNIFKNNEGYQLYSAYGYIVKKFISEDATVYLFGIALISGIFAMIGYRGMPCLCTGWTKRIDFTPSQSKIMDFCQLSHRQSQGRRAPSNDGSEKKSPLHA